RDLNRTQPSATRAHVCGSHFLHTTKGSSREEPAIVQKRRCETSSSARACAAVAGNPRILLWPSRTLKKRDGRAGLSPTRPSNSETPSSRLRYSLDVPRQYAPHSTFPTIRYSLIGPDNTRLG